MEQLTFVGPRDLQWREVPDPEIGSADAVLVRPVAVATCDLDAGIVGGSSLRRASSNGPMPPMHSRSTRTRP